MTDRTDSSSQPASSTASHPPAGKPDPTVTEQHNATQGGVSAASSASSSELARLKVNLRNGLRKFPDFPKKGILFEDIMPLFSSPSLHADLARALELQVAGAFTKSGNAGEEIDVVVGLESRGFLFGPTLALRLGAGFVPVRKPNKLPGELVTAKFEKEYGADEFAMQADAIKEGQRVLIVDDIIATGGSAAAAGELVRKLGGDLCGYLFIMELDFLKGRDKLDAPVSTLLSGQEQALAS